MHLKIKDEVQYIFPHISSNGKTSIPLKNESPTISMCF